MGLQGTPESWEAGGNPRLPWMPESPFPRPWEGHRPRPDMGLLPAGAGKGPSAPRPQLAGCRTCHLLASSGDALTPSLAVPEFLPVRKASHLRYLLEDSSLDLPDLG